MERNIKYMFGWSAYRSGINSEDIAYDYRPETLYIALNKLGPFIDIPICKIISEYIDVQQCIIQIWNESCRMNCNWFGRYTYGTSWLRGTKVWLTPKGGLLMQGLKKANCDTLQISKNYHEHKTNKMKYDSARQPIDCSSPTKLLEHLTTSTKYTFADNTERFMIAFFPDETSKMRKCKTLLRKYLNKGKVELESFAIYNQKYELVDDDDPTNGGVNLALFYNLSETLKELQWIENVCIDNHNIDY